MPRTRGLACLQWGAPALRADAFQRRVPQPFVRTRLRHVTRMLRDAVRGAREHHPLEGVATARENNKALRAGGLPWCRLRRLYASGPPPRKPRAHVDRLPRERPTAYDGAGMNLILLNAGEVDADGRAVLTDARATHISQVLRARQGQELRIGLLDGPLGLGIVDEEPAAGRVSVRCRFATEVPARPRVDLLLALPRPKVMRRLWPQLAALGVGRIVLTNAERVERPYFDTHVLEPETYRTLLVEGLQQARDTRVPEVSVHKQFRVLVEDHLEALCPDTARVLADPAGEASVATVVGRDAATRRVLVAVGPEGGWNAFERNLLTSCGFRAASMGPRTFRSDTACVALLALVHDALRATQEAAR